MMEASGRIAIRNNPGTSYENFIANVIYANSSFQGNLTGNVTGDVSGNAATAGGLVVETGRNNNANRIVRTDASGYIQCGYINSSNGNENNNANADRVWGTNGTDDYLRTYRTSALSVASAVSATYLNSSNYINRTGTSGNYNTDFQNTPAGSVRHHGDDSSATNNPGGTWWFIDNYRHSNGSNYWGTQVAWGWEDNANRLATRNITGGSFQGWVYYLNSSNYNSYAPTLTGTGASGTWGISITGNSATTSQRSFSGDFSISGTSNTPLSINSTEPFMDIVANGGSNAAGLRLYPTTNYDAYIGNYRGAGKLWLIAGNADNAYVDSAGSLFNRTGTYGTISDITLKENIINATPKLQDLLKLKVRNFNFIGKDEKLLGFIAQEFEEVFPNAINTDTGFGDMNGKKVVKTTVLIPMLVKAIQEQQTLITELQEKLERNNIT